MKVSAHPKSNNQPPPNTIPIGTSGWVYHHWKSKFYPKNLPQEEWLDFYAKKFNSVEINNTFYQLPDESTFRKWKEQTPQNFLFAVKANRYITHMKNLLEPKDPVRRLFDRCSSLGNKLGPILFQLPPQWKVNVERLRDFVQILPTDRRCAFEFRNPSWYCPEVYQVLHKNNCAFCIHDHQNAPSPEIVTADFVYIRFHGPTGNYGGKYRKGDLGEWKKKISNWAHKDKDMFTYFNNDMKAYSAQNAEELKSLSKS